MKVTIFRVQDAEGRGPYRPGMSQHWVDLTVDETKRPPWIFEMGMVHKKAFTWEHVGCGFNTLAQLHRWFTRSELKRLVELGYRVVELEVDRILGESPNQIVFTRRIPLRDDVKVVEVAA